MTFLLKHLLFRLDPEKAHHGVIRLLSILGSFRIGRKIIRIACGASSLSSLRLRQATPFPVLSRIGLAAGLDKNGEIVASLPSFGFGFAEIGTVTLRPQEGNLKPRLFRDLPARSLFNRMGFNNDGAAVVSQRLAKLRQSNQIPAGFSVGVNVGKNKNTSLDAAATDYALTTAAFRDLADYLVINVSSPNTPGLRDLQQLDRVRKILNAVLHEKRSWSRPAPVFLKLSPEAILDAPRHLGVALEEFLKILASDGVEGWILTNTLGGQYNGLPGGWSGAAVRNFSRNALLAVRPLTRLPIISVGGIDSTDEASERLREGADLIQIYSHWILNGPRFAAKISKSFSKN